MFMIEIDTLPNTQTHAHTQPNTDSWPYWFKFHWLQPSGLRFNKLSRGLRIFGLFFALHPPLPSSSLRPAPARASVTCFLGILLPGDWEVGRGVLSTHCYLRGMGWEEGLALRLTHIFSEPISPQGRGRVVMASFFPFKAPSLLWSFPSDS